MIGGWGTRLTVNVAYMFEQSDPETKLYDIRITTTEGKALLFAKALATDQEAADHAKCLMLRHACESGEVWCGMKLIRQL